MHGPKRECFLLRFFLPGTSTRVFSPLSLHALFRSLVAPLVGRHPAQVDLRPSRRRLARRSTRSEEQTSELQSPMYMLCRPLLENNNPLNYSKTNANKVTATRLNGRIEMSGACDNRT